MNYRSMAGAWMAGAGRRAGGSLRSFPPDVFFYLSEHIYAYIFPVIALCYLGLASIKIQLKIKSYLTCVMQAYES